MVKSLKEWYDGLPEATQQWVDNNCNSWFDISKPDYYDIKSVEMEDIANACHGDWYLSRRVADAFERMLGYLLDKHPDILSDEVMKQTCKLAYANNWHFIRYVNLATKRWLAVEQDKSGNKPGLTLSTILLLTDDFDNIDFSMLDTESLDLDKGLEPILGEEMLYKIYKENPTRMRFPKEIYDDNFDKLFFGEDGWTDNQKKEIIRSFYKGSEYRMDDFLSRIVAVDKSYLKYIGMIVAGDPSMADRLYSKKKPDEEIDPNQPVFMRFRYPREVRKLLQIAGCCARKSIPKTRAQKCGDIAAILKLYNYDFNMIFDAMYPEFIEVPETTETTEEQVA